MKIQEAFEFYVSHGFSCFPIKIYQENGKTQKRPLVEWKKYQSRMPAKEEIMQWKKMNGANGIAIPCGKFNNLVVIDLDKKKFATEEEFLQKKEELEKLIPDSLYFPVVSTPSGGLHWWFRLGNRFFPSMCQVDGWIDVLSENKVAVVPPSEGYNFISELYIDEIPEIPEELYIYFMQKVKEENIPSIPPLKFEKGYRDNNMFTVALRLLKAGFSVEEVYRSLTVIARGMDTSDIKNVDKWIREKIHSALKRVSKTGTAKKKEENLTDKIIEFARDVKEFTLSECATACEIKIATAGKLLLDLMKKGIVERIARGAYRIVEEVEMIDIIEEVPAPEPLLFPLDLHHYFSVYRGNIILLAGAPNAGKTAFSLNFAYLNRDICQVHYFSSEMGREELSLRVSKMPPIEEWKKIRFYNFSVTQIDIFKRFKDSIIVIDYLDIPEEFYKIAVYLKNLHDIIQETKSIAFVCIQKDPHKNLGRGSSLALEKPRVYLTMDAGVLNIVKAKNWRNPELNPNGLKVMFKLVNGIQFIKTGIQERR